MAPCLHMAKKISEIEFRAIKWLYLETHATWKGS